MLLRYEGPRRFVFVSNTKSASTSVITSSLAAHAQIQLLSTGKHMGLSEVCARFDFLFDETPLEDFLTFGIIRDPVEWVVSWFNFRSRPQLADPKHPLHANFTGDLTFAQFWDQLRDGSELRPQSTKFFADQDTPIDVLIRFDRLAEDLAVVAGALGLKRIQLGHRNRSTVRRFEVHRVEQAIRDEIRDVYESDYLLLEKIETTNNAGLKRYATKTESAASLPSPVMMQAKGLMEQTRAGDIVRAIANRRPRR